MLFQRPHSLVKAFAECHVNCSTCDTSQSPRNFSFLTSERFLFFFLLACIVIFLFVITLRVLLVGFTFLQGSSPGSSGLSPPPPWIRTMFFFFFFGPYPRLPKEMGLNSSEVVWPFWVYLKSKSSFQQIACLFYLRVLAGVRLLVYPLFLCEFISSFLRPVVLVRIPSIFGQCWFMLPPKENQSSQ